MPPQSKDMEQRSALQGYERNEAKKYSSASLTDDEASSNEMTNLLGDSSEADDPSSFIMFFLTSSGPPQVAAIVVMLAIGFGCIIGVVPATMTDRFAKLYHGLPEHEHCGGSPHVEACIQGSADAQNASAIASLVSNTLTLISSSVVGSLSDINGRRIVIIIGVFLSTLSPTALFFIQRFPNMNPCWYYTAQACSGFINWIAVALSSLSDVLPPRLRAPGVGLFMAFFWAGLSIAPSFTVFLNVFQATALSWGISLAALLFTIFFFKETLSPETAAEAKRKSIEERKESDFANKSSLNACLWNASKPIRSLSILNRSDFFRKVSLLAFFSGMANAGDQSLLLYYIEQYLAFTMSDIAVFFIVIGGVSVVVQSFLLKPVNDLVGERYVLVISFTMSMICNVIYGLATNKMAIFVAVAFGGISSMAFPTISAIKSNNVLECEQGQIQGALYSIQAIASGVGPVLMRYVEHLAQDTFPGAMFLFAGMLQFTAVIFSWALPKDKTNSKRSGPTPIVPAKECYDAMA